MPGAASATRHAEFRWPSARFLAGAFLLFVSMLLGGGTFAGLPSDLILELTAWPILVALLAGAVRYTPSTSRLAVAFALGLGVVPLVQLVPLPPAIWTALPGRAIILDGLNAAGATLGWRPLTLSRSATFSSLTSLAAPISVFILMTQLTWAERRGMISGLLAFTLLAVLVALLQVGQGEESPLRFYAVTNPNQAVGFFANRNHFAASLYMVLPVTIVWIVWQSLDLREARSSRLDPMALARIAFLAVALGAVLLALGLTASRAGLALAVLGILGSFAALAPLRHRILQRTVSRSFVVALAASVGLAAVAGIVWLVRHATVDLVDYRRLDLTVHTFSAALKFLPVGAGMGTFVPVYFAFEPQETADTEYANRAHNDFVETLLEAGVAAPILILLFLGWWGSRVFRMFEPDGGGRTGRDAGLARAAAVAVVLPVIHSVLDYPLRTTAIMTLLAVMAGCMTEAVTPSPQTARERPRRRHSRRSRAERGGAVA